MVHRCASDEEAKSMHDGRHGYRYFGHRCVGPAPGQKQRRDSPVATGGEGSPRHGARTWVTEWA